MALYTLAVPLWGWHSHQITSTECDFLGGCSGQLVKRVGLRKVEVSTGLGVTGVGRGETKPGEARSCLLTTYFNPLNQLPSAPAFFFFFLFANLSSLWILVPQPGIETMFPAMEA